MLPALFAFFVFDRRAVVFAVVFAVLVMAAIECKHLGPNYAKTQSRRKKFFRISGAEGGT